VLEKTKILLILRSEQDDVIETIRESATYRIVGYACKECITDMDIPYI